MTCLYETDFIQELFCIFRKNKSVQQFKMSLGLAIQRMSSSNNSLFGTLLNASMTSNLEKATPDEV